MADITHLFGGAYKAVSPVPKTIQSHEAQLIDAISASGMDPPKTIYLDGKIHRFSSTGKRGDDSGWYVIFPDGPVPAGSFGDWRTGSKHDYRGDIGRALTADEIRICAERIENAKKEREKERERMATISAAECQTIFAGAMPASLDHPYIERKGLASTYGAKVTGDGRLIVPIFDKQGEIRNLQYINHDGEKKYHGGAEITGCSFVIQGSEKIYLCEGYATGASIFEATGGTVVCAMSANNLPPVANLLTGQVVVVADNDESGTGERYGRIAAEAIGARLVMPPIRGDANDYSTAGHDLSALLNPPLDEWLMPADDFSAEQKPIRWLIKKWFQAGGLSMIHGPSGAGKTFVVIDLCCRIAGGYDRWMGENVKNGAVVYLAGEGHHGLRQRIAAWKQHNNAGSLNMWVGKSAVDINEPNYTAQTIDYLRQLPEKPCLVVIDTLHRFLSGNENSAEDAKSMIDACNAIQREFGCSVWLVHHTGVSDDAQHRARGSSAWKGALDNEVNIQRDKLTNSIVMTNPKQKDGELQNPKYLDLQGVRINGWFDDDGEQVSSAVIVEGAPLPEKTNSKLVEKLSILRKVWDANGSQLLENGAPFVTRDQVVSYLIEIGKTERAATHQVSLSKENGLIHELIKQNVIKHDKIRNEYELLDHALTVGWKFCSGKQ